MATKGDSCKMTTYEDMLKKPHRHLRRGPVVCKIVSGDVTGFLSLGASYSPTGYRDVKGYSVSGEKEPRIYTTAIRVEGSDHWFDARRFEYDGTLTIEGDDCA